MADPMSGEGFLLALLNSTPVVDGVPTDDLADPARARAWLAGVGGLGTEEELRQVLEVRRALQDVVRGDQQPTVLAPALQGVARIPALADDAITWTLCVPPERELAVRAVLAWDDLAKQSPARLRPCANDECRLFLIDHSKANTARWCSMAVCGNRMKARRHYQRVRGASASTGAADGASGQRAAGDVVRDEARQAQVADRRGGRGMVAHGPVESAGINVAPFTLDGFPPPDYTAVTARRSLSALAAWHAGIRDKLDWLR